MSEANYEYVIRTEFERMEMMVDIYECADRVRDHDFRTETNTHQSPQSTGSDCVKIRSSRAAVVCLVVLCVLLLTAVIVLCVYIHTNYTNYTRERDELLSNITNLTEERDELLTRNTNLERDQLLTNISDLTEERKQILTNNTKLIKVNKKLKEYKKDILVFLNTTDEWLYYKLNFYYISSEKKSWAESRRYCTERGADLIIINNKEEQDFIMKKSGASGVWIGLTDSDEEGTWKWVNGSNMTYGFSFWAYGEPRGGTSENCVVSFSWWHDYPCNHDFKWICEKNILKWFNTYSIYSEH